MRQLGDMLQLCSTCSMQNSPGRCSASDGRLCNWQVHGAATLVSCDTDSTANQPGGCLAERCIFNAGTAAQSLGLQCI